MPAEPDGDAAQNTEGRLATRFQHALAETRRALGSHASLLPSGRIARFDALIADFDKRRIRIAVYGEVKAGKSTLVNALAGADLTPASFGPLTSAPVRITYGPQTAWSAGGKSYASVDELAAALASEATDEVTITTDLDLLQLGGQVDLVDTPGVGSEDRFDEISAQALRTLDAVILVVRYPALFTRFTRHLMASLEEDIGKLLVVWNMDGACDDLSSEDRERYLEDLRRKVAGAHELYAVDARRALAAARDDDAEGRRASGLADLIDGISRYATSDRRVGTAVREAAKRAEKWMRQADEALRKRQAALESSLMETQRQLQALREDAEQRAAAERQGLDDFLATVAATRAAFATAGESALTAYRKQLRKVRRRWIRKGDADALAAEVSSAGHAYADAIEKALREATDAFHGAAEAFATRVTTAPRERIVPSVAELGPEDRLVRATEGRLRRTRRALRRRWYLPGFEQLYHEMTGAAVDTHRAWVADAARSAEGAASATLDAKLAEIEASSAAAAEQLARERRLAEEESELEALRRDVPIVAEHRAGIAALGAAARAS